MMEQMSGLFPNRLLRMDDIMKFTPLTPQAQQHLAKVYTLLAGGVLCSTFGVFFWMSIFRVPPLLSGLAAIGCMMTVMGTQSHHDEKHVATPKRLAIAGAFAFFKGLTIGGLVESAQILHPGVVVSALTLTFLIFSSLTIAALVAKRRQYLFLGGILGSLTSMMFFGSLINMFVRSKIMFDISLYLGLVVFIGYILVDTQVIIEQALNGRKDYLCHACELYIDMVGVFVRIMIILLRNAEQRDRRDAKRRR